MTLPPSTAALPFSLPTTSDGGGLTAYISSLGDNPYFGAGAGLFGIGMAVSMAKRSSVVLNSLARRRLMVSLEISNEDPAYDWLLTHMNKQIARQSHHLSVKTTFARSASGRVKTDFTYVPAPGDHYMWLKGRLVMVERNRESQMMRTPAGGQMGVPFETVKLSTFGWSSKIFDDLLNEARISALGKLEASTVIYHPIGPNWKEFGNPRKKRPLSSVVLDDGIAETLVADVQEFTTSAEWYNTRGIPHRRGYLLYGPPGCGKSSFISALASHLDYSICVLSMSERTMTDDRLDHLLNTAPLQSIILLEDVDAAFVSREDHPSIAAAYEGLSRVTFSGLLNAIDGVSSAEARIVMMTTNYVDRLDPALIRPGRVDVKRYIGNCSNSQLERMFVRFFADDDNAESVGEQARKFAMLASEQSTLHSLPISAAQVQGFLLLFKNNPNEAVKNAKNVVAYGRQGMIVDLKEN